MSGVVKRQDKADLIADKLQTLYPEIPIPLSTTAMRLNSWSPC